MEFSRQRACILSRSALQLLYLNPSPASTAAVVQGYFTQKPGAFVDILRESVKTFVNPPAMSGKGVGGNPPVSKL